MIEVKQMTTEEKWSTLTVILKYIKGCETSKTTPTLEKWKPSGSEKIVTGDCHAIYTSNFLLLDKSTLAFLASLWPAGLTAIIEKSHGVCKSWFIP